MTPESRINNLAILGQNQFLLDNSIEELIYELNIMMMVETLPSRQLACTFPSKSEL
jgi:hypothetical protein